MTKNKTKKEKAVKQTAMQQISSSLSLLTLGLALIAFARKILAHKTTIFVYAPKHGLYHWLYTTAGQPLHIMLVNASHMISSPNAIGWAVIMITINIKLILMPFNYYMSAKNNVIKEKMKLLEPQLAKLNKVIHYYPLSKKERNDIDALRKEVIDKNKIPKVPIWMTVLVTIVESLVTIPLYQSIAYSKDISQGKFFFAALNKRSIVLAIFVGLMSLLATYTRMSGMDEERRLAEGKVKWFAPAIESFAVAYFFPAIIALYNLSSNFMRIIENYMVWHLGKKKVKKQYANADKNSIIEIVTLDRLSWILSKDTLRKHKRNGDNK